MGKIENLKSGDVLVFKAGDNWLSKAISWLTDSDVSHAAMMLNDGKMVEMGSNGISTSSVEMTDGENTIVLRLSPEKDSAPLISAAKKYTDCKTRYDFPALAFLAGLIIYRRVRPTQKFVAITDIILRSACVMLDKLIQIAILKNPDKAMVCSQLVYQVYQDCGKEYHIKIEDGLLQAADGTICLADLALESNELLDVNLAANTSFPDDEALAKELYLALIEQESDEETLLGTADLGALPSWVNVFVEKLEEFLEKSKSNLPIDALFITPADLAYKSKNLETIGNVEIRRLK